MTDADRILKKVYAELRLNTASSEQKYNRINDIIARLKLMNSKKKINTKTTGTISERLCRLALNTAFPANGAYKRITDKWNWMADYSVHGHPFNLLISVKSFKAKERLLVSGSGNLLSPTVGWGLFDDKSEWTEERVRLYLFRSFIAIYIPSDLLSKISTGSRCKPPEKSDSLKVG